MCARATVGKKDLQRVSEGEEEGVNLKHLRRGSEFTVGPISLVANKEERRDEICFHSEVRGLCIQQTRRKTRLATPIPSPPSPPSTTPHILKTKPEILNPKPSPVRPHIHVGDCQDGLSSRFLSAGVWAPCRLHKMGPVVRLLVFDPNRAIKHPKSKNQQSHILNPNPKS